MEDFSYVKCKDWQEAAQFLVKKNHKCKLIAGGTDVLVQMKNKKTNPEVLLDISKIPDACYIRESSGYIEIGALTTHAEISSSELVREKACLLARACSLVGSPQIRNMGTLVGNVVNAQPAADGALALQCLEAEVKALEASGERWLKIEDTYQGPGQSSLQEKLVTAIRFKPLKPQENSSFQRTARRESLALPILNVAAVVEVVGGLIGKARICMAPVAPVPLRVKAVEEFLQGKKADVQIIEEAGKMAASYAEPRDSRFRGSKKYRKQVIAVLVENALKEAAGGI